MSSIRPSSNELIVVMYVSDKLKEAIMMFGLIYIEGKQPQAVEQEFSSIEAANTFAKENGYEEYKVVPLSTGKLDLTSANVDLGIVD